MARAKYRYLTHKLQANKLVWHDLDGRYGFIYIFVGRNLRTGAVCKLRPVCRLRETLAQFAYRVSVCKLSVLTAQFADWLPN